MAHLDLSLPHLWAADMTPDRLGQYITTKALVAIGWPDESWSLFAASCCRHNVNPILSQPRVQSKMLVGDPCVREANSAVTVISQPS